MTGYGPRPRHHLTIHLEGEAASVVEELRSRWDPMMRQIAPAHITVVYPEETVDPALLLWRAARVADEIAPFEARLATFAAENGGHGGVVSLVDDFSGGLETIRDRLLLPPQRFSGFPFHATIAHPRTASDPAGCWAQLAGTGLDLEFTVHSLLWTATDSATRSVLETFPLTGTPSPPHSLVGGLILRGETVLLGLRHPDRTSYPDVWDVPGGHVEPGESPRSALRRELREELGIDATVGAPWRRIQDRGAGIDLSLWVIHDWRGEVRNCAPREQVQLRWCSADTLTRIPLVHPTYRLLLVEALNR